MAGYRRTAEAGALAAFMLASGCAVAPGERSDGGVHARGVTRHATPDAEETQDTPQAATDSTDTRDKGAPQVAPEAASADASASEAAPPAQGSFPAGLVVEDLRAGDGAPCEASSLVVIRYEGRVQGGASFARTPAGQQDGPWPVAALVPGLRDGMVGMREGGRRRIVVPPDLAYGDTPVTDEATGAVRIPANATLVFTVELLEVRTRTTGAPTVG